jgi:hypothetical protein
MYICTPSLTLAPDGVGCQHHAPAALPPGKTRYPLYRRLGGPQGRSGRVRKIWPPPPTGIRSPERPPCSESLYRQSYLCPRRYPSNAVFCSKPYDCEKQYRPPQIPAGMACMDGFFFRSRCAGNEPARSKRKSSPNCAPTSRTPSAGITGLTSGVPLLKGFRLCNPKVMQPW